MLKHYSKTIKFKNLDELNEFSKTHIMTEEDHLDFYRDGTYGFPMVINATAMFCQNGDFCCFISGHDEFSEKYDNQLTSATDFIAVKNAMQETKA